MSHLEEGTIHAWLDGELPPDEAARVEAHARDCADCSAMVAEARGFIAGSSRIVSSLDIVRGDVIPAAAGASTKPAPRGSLWGALKFTPARAAIAATLLIGVASMFTLRRQDDMKLASPSARIVADTVVADRSAGRGDARTCAARESGPGQSCRADAAARGDRSARVERRPRSIERPRCDEVAQTDGGHGTGGR